MRLGPFIMSNEDKGSALDIGQDAQVGSHGRIFRGKAHGTAFAH